ncbi:MAG: hypothetical protein ISEC1_P0198 [Thiomicrorhabdus sp.]|nr:MAG: hypothetical protein ISEC1_P0198 [Thiomicrorhabdus sp.]
MSNHQPALLPFNYVLIMALSSCGLWLLNVLFLKVIDSGFFVSILISLVLAVLLWLPWLRMFIQSDRPDKRIMKPLFPHYFWSSLLGTTLLLVTIVGFAEVQLQLESDVSWIQHTAQLVMALHFIWFWRWSYYQFYHYAVVDQLKPLVEDAE